MLVGPVSDLSPRSITALTYPRRCDGGRGDAAAFSGQAVGAGGGLHRSPPVVGGRERTRRLRRRRPLVAARRSRRIGARRPRSPPHRGRVGGNCGRQAAADACGEVNQKLQTGHVAEADGVMQRQHFDRPLTGLLGTPGSIKRQIDCSTGISLRRRPAKRRVFQTQLLTAARPLDDP